MQLRGLVVEKTVALGSKSERATFVLQSDKGDFVLRLQGANPFQKDATFEPVVGQEIEAEGKVLDYLFVVDSWKTVEAEYNNKSRRG